MTVSEIHDAKRRLQPDVARLEAERTFWDNRLTTALAEPDPDRYDPTLVAYCRQKIAVADGQLRDLRDRFAALETQLPSADVVRAKTAEARTLVTSLDAAHERMVAAQRQHVEAFDVIEGTSRDLLDATRSAREIRTRATTLVQQFALDVVVPLAPRVSAVDVQRADLVGLLLRAVLDSEPADLVANLDALHPTCDEATADVVTADAIDEDVTETGTMN